MSLNNIDLPGIVIAELYKNNLLEASEKESRKETAEKKKTTQVQYLGKNGKHITILVHYPSDVYLPEEQLNFLGNVLKACGLNIGDIAIVNTAMRTLDAATILKELETDKLLVFRNMPLLNIPGEPFTITKLGNIPVLTAPTLETINHDSEDSKLLKSKLWGCLKQMFVDAP